MITIPNDTQLSIYATFIKLWHEVGYEKIRIAAICAQTPVARSTFYSYYDSLDDLKDQLEDYYINQLIQVNQPLFDKVISDPRDIDFIQVTLACIDKDQPVYQAFLVDQLNTSFIDKWKAAIKKHFEKILPKSINRELTLELIASAVVTTVTFLLKYPETQLSYSELQNLVFRVLD